MYLSIFKISIHLPWSWYWWWWWWWCWWWYDYVGYYVDGDCDYEESWSLPGHFWITQVLFCNPSVIIVQFSVIQVRFQRVMPVPQNLEQCDHWGNADNVLQFLADFLNMIEGASKRSFCFERVKYFLRFEKCLTFLIL